MKRSAVVLIALFLSFSLSMAATLEPLEPEENVLTFDGYMQIKIGMHFKEASRVSGLKFSEASEEDECTDITADALPGLSFMIINGRIARIDVVEGNYSTPEGVMIGDSEAKVKRIYSGRVKVERHHYDQDGHYLIIRSANRKRMILFETDGKKVTTWRVGRLPEVEYVEGCA